MENQTFHNIRGPSEMLCFCFSKFVPSVAYLIEIPTRNKLVPTTVGIISHFKFLFCKLYKKYLIFTRSRCEVDQNSTLHLARSNIKNLFSYYLQVLLTYPQYKW